MTRPSLEVKGEGGKLKFHPLLFVPRYKSQGNPVSIPQSFGLNSRTILDLISKLEASYYSADSPMTFIRANGYAITYLP